MILEALVAHYEALAKLGKISPPGWSMVKVSYALCIDEKGGLEQVICLKTEQPRGKKTALVPKVMQLPAPVKRSSGIAPNFLCDNSSYMLGIDAKGKPQRAKDCFAAAAQHHREILLDVDTPESRAICAFFETWDPDKALEYPALQNVLEDILAGANLVFRYQFHYPHESPQIRQAWEHHYSSDCGGVEEICLVTGEKGPIETVHPSLKGVKDAQSSGAALVSFNAPAFWSYGKEYGENAPIGKYAAFAYTTALNYLLSDRERVFHMGDATVVFWAKNGEISYQNFASSFVFDTPSNYTADELSEMVKALCSGQQVSFDESRLDPEMEFYILGISPNAARLSVRFFLRNRFGKFLQNVMDHHSRMEIVRPSFDKFETVPLWKLLDETVNQNSRTKTPAPNLAGETLRAILNNTPYPAQLLNGVNLRIRAEHEITRGRAAIIKAFYLKNPHKDVPKEVLTVALNPNSTSIPYTLGRLFSVLENIQEAANPGINTTIKDRYFNAASATPAHVFPSLINLAQKHLRKLDSGFSVHYDKQLTELLSRLGENYPTHLSIPEQGAFQLGYYHQTQARYTSRQNKEEK